MNTRTIIRQVSLDLNDQEPGYEYTRWTYDQLASYLQEALNHLYNSLKYLFTAKVVVPLEYGDVWQDACQCEDIQRVLGMTNAEGTRILKRLRRRTDDDSIVWSSERSAKCSYGKKYEAESYMINATDGRSFMVFPPVPPSAPRQYALIECYAPLGVETGEEDVPFEVVAAAKQWMLYRAMMIDSENNATIAEIGLKHRETYFSLVQDLVQTRALEEARDENGGAARPVQNRSSE